MKFETSTILTLEEIKAQNYTWVKNLVIALMPQTLTDKTTGDFEMAKGAIGALPNNNAPIDHHIQFWLDHCSGEWYDKQAAENVTFETNVIVQYVDSNNQTRRRWICCEDPEIY